MNKARRITTRSSRRPYRRYPGHSKHRGLRAVSDSEPGRRHIHTRLYEDTINASHLQHRSVRSEAIEDYAVHSIHLSPESITATKIALGSVDPEHLSFNPVQGVSDGPLLQQFGSVAFTFPVGDDFLKINIPFKKSYSDNQYTLVCSTSSPELHPGVLYREGEHAIIGVSRSEDFKEESGLLHWIAVGWS